MILALCYGEGGGTRPWSTTGRRGQAQGDYRRAIDCLGQAVVSFDGARRHERFGHPILPAVLVHAALATCHAELGRFAAGRDLGAEGLRMVEAVAHPGSLLYASHGMGMLSLRQGDLPRALPLLERAVGICHEADLPAYFPPLAAALGAAYALGGHAAAAVSLLTHGIEQATAMDMGGLQALCRLPLGEAQLLADRLEEAHALAEQALALSRDSRQRGHEAYALRLLGDIAARREPLEVKQAEAHYQQALALAEELGMRPLQAHCHRGLGTLYAATGQREQARAEQSAAIEMYRTMEMTFWLPQTEAALRRWTRNDRRGEASGRTVKRFAQLCLSASASPGTTSLGHRERDMRPQACGWQSIPPV